MSKNFAQVVADQRRGQLSEQAGEEFAKLVVEVNTLRRPAEFNLKIKLVPNPNQPELPGLRSVDAPQREVVYVQVDRSSGEVIQQSTQPPAAQAIAPQTPTAAQVIAATVPAAIAIHLAPTPGEALPPAAAASASFFNRPPESPP